MPTEKRGTSYRLSEEARSLILRLAEVHGVNQTAVLEMAIRLLARRDLPAGTEDPRERGRRRK